MSSQVTGNCLDEADFNWWNKLIFARRMMDNAREAGVIPKECFTKKHSKWMGAITSKTFFVDASKVLHHPNSIEVCDLEDCYDRTART